MTSVYQIGHTLPCAQNCRVYFTALSVSSSALDVALEQMMVHCVENDLWDLRPGCIVKEGESVSPIQGWKCGANDRNGKALCGPFGIEDSFGLQMPSRKKDDTFRRGLE